MLTKYNFFLVLFCVGLATVFGENAAERIVEREIRPSGNTEKKKEFFKNPLLLDGIILDYSFFSINSRGKLAVVKGDPNSPQAVKIPFQVYLKRSGKPIAQQHPGWQGVEVDLAEVMALANVGDELIIEPLHKEHAVARRSIRLKLFWFLSLTGGKGDGC